LAISQDIIPNKGDVVLGQSRLRVRTAMRTHNTSRCQEWQRPVL
jgi:hypothetical protein